MFGTESTVVLALMAAETSFVYLKTSDGRDVEFGAKESDKPYAPK
jgi:hypothetical protein